MTASKVLRQSTCLRGTFLAVEADGDVSSSFGSCLPLTNTLHTCKPHPTSATQPPAPGQPTRSIASTPKHRLLTPRPPRCQLNLQIPNLRLSLLPDSPLPLRPERSSKASQSSPPPHRSTALLRTELPHPHLRRPTSAYFASRASPPPTMKITFRVR